MSIDRKSAEKKAKRIAAKCATPGFYKNPLRDSVGDIAAALMDFAQEEVAKACASTNGELDFLRKESDRLRKEVESARKEAEAAKKELVLAKKAAEEKTLRRSTGADAWWEMKNAHLGSE